MDLMEFAEPEEVYEAIIGHPERLIQLLRNNKLTYRHRSALAAWFEGTISAKKRGRPKRHLYDAVFSSDNFEPLLVSLTITHYRNYRRVIQESEEPVTINGEPANSERVWEHVRSNFLLGFLVGEADGAELSDEVCERSFEILDKAIDAHRKGRDPFNDKRTEFSEYEAFRYWREKGNGSKFNDITINSPPNP